MILLDSIVEAATSVFLNYGAMGAILVLCILALYKQNKSAQEQWQKLDDRHVAEITKLRDQFNEFVNKDRQETISTMKEVSGRIHEMNRDLRTLLNKGQ